MIDLKQAYSIAWGHVKGEYGAVSLRRCVDIGDRYAFTFGSEDGPFIGAPVYAVAKEDGALTFLHIPPRENLTLLKSGIAIDLSAIETGAE